MSSMSPVLTPPPTELSTASPTEIDSFQQPAAHIGEDMSRSITQHQRPIYLIVATALSPRLGIGNKGDLPWSQIRSDMAFFRRVTSGEQKISSIPGITARNAVIMGRKTWNSIPERFRPLAGRVNVVLTRSDSNGCRSLGENVKEELERKNSGNEAGIAWNLNTEENSKSLGSSCMIHLSRSDTDLQSEVIVTNSLREAANLTEEKGVNGLFCIGGAEIYGMILRDQNLRHRVRVLQTLVQKVDGEAFECDTFWPEQMEDGVQGWKEVKPDTVRQWIGTDLPQGQQDWHDDEKAGVRIKVIGWEQV